MKILAALAVLWTGCLTWLGLDHPYGLRFAMGIWPVPQGTPWSYQLESGFVPALTVLTLLSSVAALYHVRNCHWDGCWRLGRHHVNGSPYCNQHHQQVKPETSENELLAAILDRLASIHALLDEQGQR